MQLLRRMRAMRLLSKRNLGAETVKVKTAGRVQGDTRSINQSVRPPNSGNAAPNEHRTWRSEQIPGGKARALNPPCGKLPASAGVPQASMARVCGKQCIFS
nr:MAG TPA: hypothetical protein [Caudoviricetes sp.]